jgi:Dolichyl-phosphate-mannose-protein mannosyltransferase
MARDLQRAGYALPAATTYNAADVPFAYPPLGFYLAGFAAAIGPWSLLDVFRLLPLLCCLLLIPAFYGLARRLLDPLAAACAVVAFALLPRSFEWLLMGGGVTRAPGLLFAVLALWQAHRLYTRGGAAPLLLTTLFAAATVLSHPEMAWFLAYSGALLWLAWGRTRRATAASGMVAAGTALLTAPWWATVLARHGPTPLLAAGSSGWTLLGLASLLKLEISDEPAFPLLGALALGGVLACLRDRRWLLPAWLAAVFLLGPRSALTVGAVPLGLLAGVGIARGLVPLLLGAPDGEPPAPARPPTSPVPSPAWASATSAPRGPMALAPPPSGALTAPASTKLKDARPLAPTAAGLRWRPLLLSVVGSFVVTYATAGAALGLADQLGTLPADERAAMAWIARVTPPASRFAVVTGERWAGDRSSEWFPALAERISVATVQGYEWLGQNAFRAQVVRYDALQACARQTADCLQAWGAESGTPFSHVYVPKRPVAQFVARAASDDCCAALRAALAADPRYQRVYDGPGAVVYARRE